MFIVLAYYVLFTSFVTTSAGVVDPPSPGRIHELINNPFLEPDNFEQFTNYDFSDLLSEDLPSHSQNSILESEKPKTESSSKEEAKQAMLLRNREYSRNWRAKVKALPDGNELKEKRKKRDREYNKKINMMYKNLPDEDEKKEARRLKRVKDHRERIQMIRNLPDDDPRKQKHFKSKSESQRKYKLKRRMEDPKYNSKKQRKQRIIAQQSNP